MPTVKLQSSDGIIFEVEEDVAKVSLAIRRVLEDIGFDEDGGGGEVVQLPNVRSSALEKVVTWATKHRNDPQQPANIGEDGPPPMGMDGQEYGAVSAWDRQFMEVDQQTLLRILLAAHQLEIKGLVHLGCKTLADLIRGKTPEQIRELLGIVNDLSPEEEEQVLRENEWSNSCDTPADWAAPNHDTERQFRDPHAFSLRGRRRAAARRMDGGPEWFQ